MSVKSSIMQAFSVKPAQADEPQMIGVLARMPGATTKQLATAMDWHEGEWKLRFGGMCSRRRAHLPKPPPAWNRLRPDGTPKPFWSGCLVDYDSRTSGLTLKPEAIEAFRELGVLDS